MLEAYRLNAIQFLNTTFGDIGFQAGADTVWEQSRYDGKPPAGAAEESMFYFVGETGIRIKHVVRGHLPVWHTSIDLADVGSILRLVDRVIATARTWGHPADRIPAGLSPFKPPGSFEGTSAIKHLGKGLGGLDIYGVRPAEPGEEDHGQWDVPL
jgi:hypothetical protein